jgi:hypothetical protein
MRWVVAVAGLALVPTGAREDAVLTDRYVQFGLDRYMRQQAHSWTCTRPA